MDKKAVQDPQLLRMLPIGQYEIVNASFAAADTDTVIATRLKPENPNDIRWIDITQGTGKVYRASDPDRKNWSSGIIILRNTAAQDTRLLLFIERT